MFYMLKIDGPDLIMMFNPLTFTFTAGVYEHVIKNTLTTGCLIDKSKKEKYDVWKYKKKSLRISVGFVMVGSDRGTKERDNT